MSEAATLEVPAALHAGVATDLTPQLCDEWRALNDCARAGSLFLSPDWLAPWWKHFGGGSERTLQLICVREGTQLVGLWPLFSEKRRIAFLGDGATGCDYLDILAAPGREREVLELALRALGELDWDVCDLDGLWRESSTALQLARRFPAARAVISGHAGLGGPTRSVVRDGRLRYVCPHIPLDGTYESYLAGHSRRENLRRREKWLFRQPGVSIDCARTPDQAPQATEKFLELHRARWSVEGGSDGLATSKHEAFHREVAPLLAQRGMLRMYTLYAARRPVASVYGVVHKNSFLYYQSGYDPLWASRSVGMVLLARTVSDAYGEGLRDFDFLRGNESYKAEWARGERWTVQLRLWRGARGRALRQAQGAALFARETVKAALPRRAMEFGRRLRRALRNESLPEALMHTLRGGG